MPEQLAPILPEQFAPILTYIVLAITLTTLSWVRPEGMWASRSIAAMILVLAEWGHVVSFLVRDLPLNTDRTLHIIILIIYIIVFGSLYRGATTRAAKNRTKPPVQTPLEPTLSSE